LLALYYSLRNWISLNSLVDALFDIINIMLGI
jgi:hypothetical protein